MRCDALESRKQLLLSHDACGVVAAHPSAERWRLAVALVAEHPALVTLRVANAAVGACAAAALDGAAGAWEAALRQFASLRRPGQRPRPATRERHSNGRRSRLQGTYSPALEHVVLPPTIAELVA